VDVIDPARAGISDPRPRQLHDEQQSGANQRTNISSINRRYRGPRRVDLSGWQDQNQTPRYHGVRNRSCLLTGVSHINVLVSGARFLRVRCT